MTIPTEGYNESINAAPNRGTIDPRQHEAIFAQLNKLTGQSCELIDRLHGKYESLKEGAQTKTGLCIHDLIIAHENFIDEMNIIEMDQNIVDAKSRLDEFITVQEKLKMRIADRSAHKMVNPVSSGGTGGGSGLTDNSTFIPAADLGAVIRHREQT